MRVNDFFDKVYVVNLDRRTDRMEKLDKQLNKLGIKYERFSAVDGKALDISPIEACSKSHQTIIRSNLDKNILILEDDALFVDDFNERFAKEITFLPEDYTVLYLGALVGKYTGKVEDIGNPYWFKQIATTGTQAYSLNPKYAQTFLAKVGEYNPHIDQALLEFARGKNPVVCQPNLVIQAASYSDLRLAEVDDFS